MTLEKAIAYAIEHEGIEIIGSTRLFHYLNDLQAFDTPALKKIVSTMVDGGYFAKLYPCISTTNYEIQLKDVEYRLVHNEGFIPNLVKYTLDCLVSAVQKGHNANVTLVSNGTSNTTKPNCAKGETLKISPSANGECIVMFNGISYQLKGKQLSAFRRKKSMPTEALEMWLKKYDAINKKTEV